MLSPAPQYRCANQSRARLLEADATFEGVLFSDVPMDDSLAPRPSQDSPPEDFPNDIDLRGRIIILHLPGPVTNHLPNMWVQNGVTISDLPIAWGVSAEGLLDDPTQFEIPPSEVQQIADRVVPLLYPLADPQNILVVRTEDIVYNGIDFLEVVDNELPADDPLRQRILLVHLLLPVPSTLRGAHPVDIVVSGGVRITNVNVVWAISATDLLAGNTAGVILNPPDDATDIANKLEKALPTDPDELGHVLVVRTDVSGDYSPYELEIADGHAEDTDGFNPPLFGFDSQLSRVTFSFKVECKSDFDCVPEETCPPDVPQAPIIDYLAKDYASFRQLMLDRLSQTFPQWEERNPSDIGVTVVELLAYAADQLSYFQDAVANEAYLGTARHRPSLRRHARLLDYTPREGTNARTFLHVEIGDVARPPGGAGAPFADSSDTTSLADGHTLKAHTALISLTDGLKTTNVTTDDLAAALNGGSQVFETMDPLTLRLAHNRIELYTWGDDDCCLPKGAVRATLDNTGKRLALDAGALLAFEEVHSPNPGAPPSPKHRHVVRLTRVRPNFDPLTKTDVLDITWAAGDALPFPLCLRQIKNDAGQFFPASIARGNIVLADHGHAVLETLPLQSTVRGNQRYLPKLKTGPLTFQAQVLDAQQNLLLVDPTTPAASALQGDPRLAAPAVLLFPVDPSTSPVCVPDPDATVDHWTPVSDLLEAGPFTQSFVVETENDGTAQLRFGDDTLGRNPTEPLFACYRTGNGSAGNIGADALAHIVEPADEIAPIAGIVAVWNTLPATGGTDPEPPQEIQLSAPQAFRVQQRAVTEADYADVALRHPGIQRAVATRRFTGSWYTMFVAVDRLGGLAVDDAFKTEFAGFLERFRLAGYDLEIQGAVPVPLKIKLTICVQTGFLRANVEKALDDALSNRVLPGGARGFFHPDNFTFGQPVFRSQLLAAVLAVPGVAQVITTDDNFVFERLHEVPSDDPTSGFLHMERLEIARLDNDPSQPENGTLELVMLGGT